MQASASRELIEQKVEGEEITVARRGAAPQAQIIDLMEALKASLSEKEAAAAGSAAASAPKATASPKAVESARERKPARRAPRAAAERASAKR